MIVLASKSASRRAMLDAAGIDFRAVPADLDERSVEARLGEAQSDEVALALAKAKALAVSREERGMWVLGSDSLVEVAGRRFDKPVNREDAASHLQFFSSRKMRLHSAVALARDGEVTFAHADLATLMVRDLSDAFIQSYLDAEWPDVGHCVGVFRMEGLGVQLFERIEGSHFTVLGMPLLSVLSALREVRELPR
ncbi:MAG: Maf family protein [Novosphingobium sp.]|nr:Maf family protein [Novosphingobium sp.]